MSQEGTILGVSADFRRLEAGLVDLDGTLLHRESTPLSTLPRGEGDAYLDAPRLFDAAARTINAVLERRPREARRLEGVSLIGRSPSVVPMGEDGPMGPFLLPRVAGAKHRGEIPWKRVYDLVGLTSRRCEIPFVIKEQAREGVTFLTPKDFIKWGLTGRISTDPLDAQRTFLYDIEARQWSHELAELFGVDGCALPEAMPATAVAGKVTAAAARATGLREGLPVACGMGDWGEYLGAGAFEVGDAFEHIGATGAFYGVTDRRPARELGFEARPHVRDGLFLAGHEGLPGGACLDWLLAKSVLARAEEIDWPLVDEELEGIAAMGRPENALFFPSLRGGHGQMEDAAFLNLHLDDDLAALIQSLVEGLFFTLKAVAEELKTMPWELKGVYTTGQVAFKHAPRRMRANIYGRRIFGGRRPGANMTSAAIAGAVACGAYRNLEEARERMLNVDGGVSPVPEARRLYEAHFATWVGTRDFLAQPSP